MLFSNTVLKYAPEPTQNVDKLSVQYKQSMLSPMCLWKLHIH